MSSRLKLVVAVKAGLITLNTGQKTFGVLRKRLNLISDIVDEQVHGEIRSLYGRPTVQI